MQADGRAGKPYLAFPYNFGKKRIAFFYDECKFLCFCRVQGRFVQYENVFAEIDVQFGIFAEKAVSDFPRLTDQIAAVTSKLLVFSGIVAD